MKYKEKRRLRKKPSTRRRIKFLKKIGCDLFTYLIPIILIAFPFGIIAYNFKNFYNNMEVVEISRYVIVTIMLTALEYLNINVSKMWVTFAIIETEKWR